MSLESYNHIGAVINTLKNGQTRISEGIAKEIQKAARSLAPVDTGHLKSSISISTDLNRTTASVVAQTHPEGLPEVPFSVNRNYAYYVEYGTVHNRVGSPVHPPQPFMTPAAEVGRLQMSLAVGDWASRIEQAASTGRQK